MKPTLWLLIADLANPNVPLIIPSLAWIAKDAGALLECYLEAQRDGTLFARTGSTVLGGYHHQQFNYLNAAFDVSYILFGQTAVFTSSIQAFQAKVLVETDELYKLYEVLLSLEHVGKPEAAVIVPAGDLQVGGQVLEISPYLFPEIFYGRALAFPASRAKEMPKLLRQWDLSKLQTLYLSPEEKDQISVHLPPAEELDYLRPDDGYGSITLRIAERWKASAKGLVFGDPPAVLSQLPTHCRESRIAVYAPRVPLSPDRVQVSAYTEEESAIASNVVRLAEEIGNRVIIGRQTCDGDIFAWSRSGVAMQIIDPNRPAFPVVSALQHPWANHDESLYDQEPSDEMLLEYAREGKILTTLLWHSGEVAHNEAMLNLFDLVSWTGVKMGIGVHAARYETCPQLWELLTVPREKGGIRGLIEPGLHSGGMGVLAEINCPSNVLRDHCEEALQRILTLAGPKASPKGYYAFMDTDYATLSQKRPEIYEAIEDSGLDYVVSSIRPGRNRIIYETERCVVINQTCRSVTSASPFVRITTVEELKENAPRVHPGWLVGTLDAPVIAFQPYIWRHGTRFMQIIEWIKQSSDVINVLPHTIARYARLLGKEGLILKDLS